MVEVIQSDRDAAADIWRDYVAKIGECLAETGIRSGGVDDGSLVQTIARHRQQAEARAERLVAALQEHHEWQMRFDLDDPEHGFNYAAEYADSGMCERTLAALTAYRSASTPPDDNAARIVSWLRGPAFGNRHPEDTAYARHIADAIERGDWR